MKQLVIFLFLLLPGIIMADDTDILKYIDGTKQHEIRWMTYSRDGGPEQKAETTIDLPALFFGDYAEPSSTSSWRDGDMLLRDNGTGWFQVYKGGFDGELDTTGNSIKKEFEWGVILNENRTIHVIDQSNNDRVLNKNEIMCVLLHNDGEASILHIMIWEGKPVIGRVWEKQ